MTVLDSFRMDGRVALLYGAGRGIGAASALALAEAGADVAIASRTQEQVDKIAAQVREMGRRALPIVADAYDAEATEANVDRVVEEFGRLDTIVSITGGTPPSPFPETDDDALVDAFRSNTLNGLRLVRVALPHLAKSDAPSIVFVSSGLGHIVGRGWLAYGMGKAALDHSVRLLAAEFSPRIRINAVAPGATMTDGLATVMTPEVKEQLERETPMHRLGTVEDIATGVLYLASPASAYVTGHILAIDGGLLKSNMDMPYPDF
jgi:7-alpha-hydroxysteroid dehydrogenase